MRDLICLCLCVSAPLSVLQTIAGQAPSVPGVVEVQRKGRLPEWGAHSALAGLFVMGSSGQYMLKVAHAQLATLPVDSVFDRVASVAAMGGGPDEVWHTLAEHSAMAELSRDCRVYAVAQKPGAVRVEEITAKLRVVRVRTPGYEITRNPAQDGVPPSVVLSMPSPLRLMHLENVVAPLPVSPDSEMGRRLSHHSWFPCSEIQGMKAQRADLGELICGCAFPGVGDVGGKRRCMQLWWLSSVSDKGMRQMMAVLIEFGGQDGVLFPRAILTVQRMSDTTVRMAHVEITGMSFCLPVNMRIEAAGAFAWDVRGARPKFLGYDRSKWPLELGEACQQ